MPEARGDIAVGPQQIGCARLGIVARSDQPCGIPETIVAADPDHADAIGTFHRGAITKLKQREPRSRLDKGFSQKRRLAATSGNRRVGHRSPWPRAAAPLLSI